MQKTRRAVAILLLIFAWFLIGIASTGLDTREGFTMYAVRDVAPMNLAPIDALRGLKNNVVEMFGRAREDNLLFMPYYAALDAWTMLTGELIFAARVFSVFCTLLIAAVLFRTDRHLNWRVLLALLISAILLGGYARQAAPIAFLFLIVLAAVMLFLRLTRRMDNRPTWLERYEILRATFILMLLAAFLLSFTFGLAKPAWHRTITAMNSQRDPLSPALTSIDPRHPLSYYDRQPETHLRQGISLDLSWQTFNDNALGQIIDSVNGANAVWFIAPQVDTQMQMVFNQLSSTHVITYEDEAGGMLFYRLYRRAMPE